MEEPRWREIDESAFQAFFGDAWDEQDETAGPERETISENAFDFWIYFDSEAPGRRPVDEVLGGPRLGEGEQRYLEVARRSCMKLYEVVEVRPGESMRLRDLVGGGELQVRERSGSGQANKWDLVAARVMEPGASGQPEIDGGLFLLPRMARDSLLEHVRSGLEEYRRDAGYGASVIEYYKTLPPFFHQTWLDFLRRPRLPRLRTSDGEELLLIKSLFDVSDREALVGRLDAARNLERDPDQEEWVWLGKGGPDHGQILLGRLRLEGERLTLETLSARRAERGRALVERLGGDAVRYRLSSRQTPEKAVEEMGDWPQEPSPSEVPPEVAFPVIEEHYARHYHKWLDDEIPALEGATPREAARSAALRPRLVEMLKDLEGMYQRALRAGQPAFAPFWMWDELGLSGQPEAPKPRLYPPPTGFESLERFVPGIADVARKVADRLRRRPGFETSTAVREADVVDDASFIEFVGRHAREAMHAGLSREEATATGNLITAHLRHLCNFELHRRKTFWVDEPLAWMLGHTRLDLAGDQLRCPFASFALVFCDRTTLETAEKMLSLVPDCELRGQILQVVTAYVTEVPHESGRGLGVAFLFDALAGQWPYLISRDLFLDPEAHLEDLLDSHLPTVDVGGLDPVFQSSGLRRLLQLVINAILYATSGDIVPEPRRPPKAPGGRSRATRDVPIYSSDEVFFLPGNIDISRVRRMQAVERAPSGGRLMHRFMVRGHWRRPAASWNVQRPRWVRPYWKGPDMATVIERAYRLKE